MTEIHNLYSKLYDKESYNLGENSITRFLDKTNAKKLSNDQREVLDKKLTRSELYQALKTFQRNKTPGNDGLTVEFYLAFWPLLELELELYFYLNTVNLSDKIIIIIIIIIIIKITIYFTLYKHDLKISIGKIEKNSALHRCRVRFVDSDEEIATTISKRLK